MLTGIKDKAQKKKLKKINVAATVKIGGKNFRVTAIGDAAFKGCTKATAIVIGKNVTTIGSSAFLGCTKVVNAIKGINKKAVIKCPKKMVKKYKILWKTSTGYKKTMKISF